jgi:hypothetical protein
MTNPVIWELALSAVVGVGTSIDASNKQKKAQKDQKNAQAVARNEQNAQEILSRRAQIREERIRRATIIQNAQNAGVAGSSGEAGAISALSASIGANLSGLSRGERTAEGIGIWSGQAQNFMDQANNSLQAGDTVAGWINSAVSGMKQTDANQARIDNKAKQDGNYIPTVITPVQQAYTPKG